MDRARDGATVRSRGWGRLVALAALMVSGACSSGADTTTSGPTSSDGSNTTSAARDVMDLGDFGSLTPGLYFVDPDLEPSTPLRVVYEVADDGRSSWIGAAKFAGPEHVGVSISTISNVVRHGCSDHSWSDPPVGSSVEDLAAALADLAPFVVTSPPEEVSAYGHRGMHLELTVPDLPVEGAADDRSFTGCTDGQLKSWVAAIDTEPGDAYYGYTGPGYVEEIWILDVEGTRVMIAAEQSPESPPSHVEEMRSILASIRIES
jgi:hypothetical protein